MNLKIKGVDYNLQFVDSYECFKGATEITEKNIYIEKDLSDDDLIIAISHELLHAYFYESGLNTYFDDEILVTFISRHFAEIADLTSDILTLFKNKNGGKH